MSFLMVLYRIYQALIAVPLLLVVTIIAAVLTAFGSMLGFSRTMAIGPVASGLAFSAG